MSRRKRAPPVRLDEEAKKFHCWNMLEDRRNEDYTLVEDEAIAGPSSSFTADLIVEDNLIGEVTQTDTINTTNSSTSITFPSFVYESHIPCSFRASISIHLNLEISPEPSEVCCWQALFGEFILELLPGQSVEKSIQECCFTLTTTQSGEQLQIRVHAKGGVAGESENRTDKLERSKEVVYLVASSFSSEMLENLRWLQKKNIIGLHHRPGSLGALKVGIFLLDSGLSKPDFLSNGKGRLKKSSVLIQKLMEKLYNFTIPDAMEENEEESNRELERENIEELYDCVRHIHQHDINIPKEDVQHPALIPVLRPYQSDAVNWMLWKENIKGSPSTENILHFLWRQVITPDRLELYYNPFTGSYGSKVTPLLCCWGSRWSMFLVCLISKDCWITWLIFRFNKLDPQRKRTVIGTSVTF